MKLTKEQYEVLVNALYIANWLVEEDEDADPNNPYAQLEQYVLEQAKEFGFEANVEKDEDSGALALTEEYEEQSDIFDVIENYEDGIFYSRLAAHLAAPELDALPDMEEEALIEKEEEIITKYYDRLIENGLDDVILKK